MAADSVKTLNEEPGCLRACVAADHTDDRVLARGQVQNGGDGRDDDHGGIGGQVAAGTDEGDHEGQDHRRDVLHLIGEQGPDQAGLLAHADGQRHGEHQAQRSEAGEVLDHVGDQPDQALAGEQVLGIHRLVLRRVDDGDAQQVEDAAQDGDDHEQVNEQDRRRRQLVTGTLQTRQELVKPALLDSPFLLVVLSHEIFLLKKIS